MSDTPTNQTVTEQILEAFKKFFQEVAQKAPDVFNKLVLFIAAYNNQFVVNVPASTGGGPVNVHSLLEDGYTLDTKAITQEQLDELRTKFSEGLIDKLFTEFIKGFVTGLMARGI